MITISTSALAERARTDSKAFEQLQAASAGLIRAAARKALGQYSWRRFGDELLGAASAALWLAVLRFDPAQHDWARLAYSTMRAEARRALREALGGAPDLRVALSDQITDESQASSLLENLDCSIGPWDRRIAYAIAEGHSQRSAAQALGVSVKAVRASLARIRKGLVNARA